jgi:hypothetical protein
MKNQNLDAIHEPKKITVASCFVRGDPVALNISVKKSKDAHCTADNIDKSPRIR